MVNHKKERSYAPQWMEWHTKIVEKALLKNKAKSFTILECILEI